MRRPPGRPARPGTARRAALAAGLGAALVAVAALGAGCAALAPPPPPAGERLIEGRFAATVIDGERRDGGSGRFTLRLAEAAASLDLVTPLGTTLARIEVDGRGARLAYPGPEGALVELSGRDATELARAALGLPLPVARIASWIDGAPDPALPHVDGGAVAPAADGVAPLRVFRQDGWTVAVLERADDGRVRRLQLDRPAAPAVVPAITLRLVVDPPR